MNHNLYAALRAQFSSHLDSTAVETDEGLHYSWRDLERASAMLANLLEGLNIPQGARIAVQVEKSVEAMMLYLATNKPCTWKMGKAWINTSPARQPQ